VKKFLSAMCVMLRDYLRWYDLLAPYERRRIDEWVSKNFESLYEIWDLDIRAEGRSRR